MDPIENKKTVENKQTVENKKTVENKSTAEKNDEEYYCIVPLGIKTSKIVADKGSRLAALLG
jgi:hypothetical protein